MSHFHKTVNFTVTAPKTSHLKRIHMKDKSVPLQAWSGPEGSRKLRFPYFMTTAQDGGKVSLTHLPPWPPVNAPGTHFCYRLSRSQGHSAIGRILCQWKIAGTFRFVAQHLNLSATAVPQKDTYIVVNFVQELAVFISTHRRMSFIFCVPSDETQEQSSLHIMRFNINSGTETRRGAIRGLANCFAVWNKSWPLIPAVCSLRYIELAQSVKPETFSLATSGRSWLRIGEF